MWPPTTIPGTPPGRCGRSWRSSTPARAGRGALPWPLIWSGRAAGSRWSRTSPGCSTPTPPTGPSCSTPGARATTRTCPRTCAGSRSCGGPCARGSASRTAAERLATAIAVLEHDPACCALPERLSLFGPTRLPADHLAVLAALARHRDVHLWLPHPSPALWDRVAPLAVGVPARRADPTAELARHPLLASLGRDVRELQLRLAGLSGVDTHHPGADGAPVTLLQRLQRDVRDDRAPAGDHVLAADDRSVAVHACHGPHRQVEVLREVVLGLLAADPTLEPRDVLVACPDVETFAPLVSAAFGLDPEGDGHPGHRLAIRLADRALRQVNPVLDVAGRLLELVDARLTASEVLDLLATSPVRRRFGLDGDDLERLRDLVTRSGVRWGLSAAHRRPYRLDGFPQNTWAAGLDRLLLGVAMEGDSWLGTALPLDDVEASDIDRLGRLAEFVDRLGAALADLSGDRPLAAWVSRVDGRPGRADRDHPRRRVAGGPGPRGARRGGPDGGCARRDPAPIGTGTGIVAAALPGRADRGRPARPRRRPRAARRAAARPAGAGQLPHRHPHRGDDGADALGAAPGDLPARAGRRRVPPRGCGRRGRRARPRPARRRARPAQRRPPAAAGRRVRRDGAPRRPLLGRRCADGCPPPARGAAGRAARRGRRHRRSGRAGARRRPPPAAALRRPQLHRRRARRTGPVQLRPRRARRVPGRCGRAGAAPAVPPGPAARHPGHDDRTRRPRDLRRAPREAVPAPARGAPDQ